MKNRTKDFFLIFSIPLIALGLLIIDLLGVADIPAYLILMPFTFFGFVMLCMAMLGFFSNK